MFPLRSMRRTGEDVKRKGNRVARIDRATRRYGNLSLHHPPPISPLVTMIDTSPRIFCPCSLPWTLHQKAS